MVLVGFWLVLLKQVTDKVELFWGCITDKTVLIHVNGGLMTFCEFAKRIGLNVLFYGALPDRLDMKIGWKKLSKLYVAVLGISPNGR